MTYKFPYYKASYGDLLERCLQLEVEKKGLEHALQQSEAEHNNAVTIMVQQAEASDSMKLQLILTGLLRSPSELSAEAARSEG